MNFLSRMLVNRIPAHAIMQKRALKESPMARFALKEGSTLVLQRGDLTKAKVDAIVNAANPRMLGGGGVDGAIHRAAGPELREACKKVEEVTPNVRCPVGEARITAGYRLPAPYVIHTVGPIYESSAESAPLLYSAYHSCLTLANAQGLKTVAFPAISCGVYGYPYDEAARIALGACEDSAGELAEISFVLFEQPAWDAWLEAAQETFGGKEAGGDQGGEAQPAAQADEGAAVADGGRDPAGAPQVPPFAEEEVGVSEQVPSGGAQEGRGADVLAGAAIGGNLGSNVASPGQQLTPMETDTSQSSEPAGAACASPLDAAICTEKAPTAPEAAGIEMAPGPCGHDVPAGEGGAAGGLSPLGADVALGRDDLDKKRKHEGLEGSSFGKGAL